MDADAALIRRASPQDEVRSVALFGAAAMLRVDGLCIHATGAAELVRTDSGWVVQGDGTIAVQ